jgi:transcriptional regulator with XRE-family HTH domain
MIGRELRVERLRAGLTQEELGRRAKVDRSFLSDLELGKQTPSLDTLFRLCEAMGSIKAWELVRRVEEQRAKAKRK